ncbi:MAG: hypothetical protein IKG21_06715 [Atopobiaceae bacterium]|nr:hypothetical protein [Atopobiaceae bacterium]
MAGITRRDVLKAGGFSATGLAAMLMGACGAQASTTDQSAGGASATGAATESTAAATTSANAARTLATNPSTGLLERSEFIGLDAEIELADGSTSTAINFDNGATTPSLVSVMEEIQAQLPMYGSIGRGKGQKSAHSTQVFNDNRTVVLDFFGAPTDYRAALREGVSAAKP